MLPSLFVREYGMSFWTKQGNGKYLIYWKYHPSDQIHYVYQQIVRRNSIDFLKPLGFLQSYHNL